MMAGKGPGKPGTNGAMKNPKRKPKKDDEDKEVKDLEKLMNLDPQDKPKWKTPSMYARLSMGEYATKGTDHKVRLDNRHKWIAAAAQSKADDDDEEDDKEEMEKERLKCETRDLESQLKKAERAEALA